MQSDAADNHGYPRLVSSEKGDAAEAAAKQYIDVHLTVGRSFRKQKKRHGISNAIPQ